MWSVCRTQVLVFQERLLAHLQVFYYTSESIKLHVDWKSDSSFKRLSSKWMNLFEAESIFIVPAHFDEVVPLFS